MNRSPVDPEGPDLITSIGNFIAVMALLASWVFIVWGIERFPPAPTKEEIQQIYAEQK